MLKKLITVLTVIFIVGCNTTTKESKSSFEGYALQSIGFLKKQGYFPQNYEKVNLNELGEMIRQNPDLDPISKQYYQMALLAHKETGKTAVLFADTFDKRNCIWLIPATYFPLNKKMVSQYVNLLENSIIPDAEQSGITYERIESKFITRGTLQAIKVKFRQEFEGTERYLTQYIITRNLETFSMTVSDKINEDHQKILKTL